MLYSSASSHHRRIEDAVRQAAGESCALGRGLVQLAVARSSMPGMTAMESDRRFGPDRRKLPRGGRRPGDADGFAPLVLVADEDVESSGRCEAILAGLRFAVAPARTAETGP